MDTFMDTFIRDTTELDVQTKPFANQLGLLVGECVQFKLHGCTCFLRL